MENHVGSNASSLAQCSHNRLLDALPERCRSRLLSLSTPVPMPFKAVLYEVGGVIDKVYFSTGAVMSALNIMLDGNAIEVATMGNEGVVGHTAADGVFISTNRVICQVPDGALSMDAATFQKEVQGDAALGQMMRRYSTAYLRQVSQSVACNGLHVLEKRCCRWLLMTHDRVQSDELKLTHELLGIMLGARRATVTDVLKPLQDEGYLRSHRGCITLLNRAAIERRACECYAVVRKAYEEVFCN
jgi:CRP-like cAMP-binding protein